MDSLCLVRPLASAIYGRVLLVRHRSSGRHYALKVMSLPHMHARRAVTGPYVQEDGDMELQILRKLGRNLVYSSGSRDNLSNSWSVSPVWSNGVADDTRAATGGQLGDQHLLTLHQDFVDWTTKTRCLLFDYCPYGDLFSQVSETRNGLPLETARTCFQQISSAVHFLHGRNVAHRDLSLENILLDGFRRCRLADFGLASAAGSRCSGSRVGKILYMAPEVFTRPPYLPKGNVNMETSTGACYNGLQADIWSLGVILFILVTGIPPFEKANEVDARFRLVSKPGGSVRALLHAWGQEDRLPRELQALLDWMLRVDPGQRPTAEQICQHQWLQPASGARRSVKESGQREKRPSADEPEAEKDGENQDPRKMANRSDKSWSWSTLRSNKRVKRMG